MDPDMLSSFLYWFLPLFGLKVPGIHMKCAMKYPRGKNEISIERARYPYEKCNEIS